MIVSGNLDKEYATIAGVPPFAKASAQLAFGKDMNGLVSLIILPIYLYQEF
jgi:aspartate/tyrosine/aromatic aminotransferase